MGPFPLPVDHIILKSKELLILVAYETFNEYDFYVKLGYLDKSIIITDNNIISK
ncbi:unnamed protein product [Sphenostylis stenocarpa]|uniref:Uncharacterized protein n=1 Tax=Sphenostylis stenocarpa TaxID=92480 RepID=A0AA86S9L3_9FABA|nr:unnamed protein product [Sphenostylis stenocarpa]